MHIDLQKGTILGETYMLVNLIGRGGMGDVWMAQHTRLPRQVAVKVLHGAAKANKTVIARFRREAEIASRLGHGNIVEVFDFNVLADGTPYMVMELLEGQSLRDRIAHGPLSLGEAVGVLRQIASALQEAHDQGIVHRDLKPDNIFLCKETIGDQVIDRIKILDFGISKIRGSQTVMTQDAEVLGTPLYMAPEQAAGQHDKIDGRTDQFALGAISYELLTGAMAFAGHTLAEVVNKIINGAPKPLGQVVANLPEHVSQAIDRAISKSIEDRFPTIVDFVNTLAGNIATAAVTLPALSATAGADDALGATMASQGPSQPATPKASSAGSQAQDPVSAFDRTAAAPGPLTGPSLTTRASAGPPEAARKGPRWALIVGGVIAVLAAVAGGVFAVGALRGRDGQAPVGTPTGTAPSSDTTPARVRPDSAPSADSAAPPTDARAAMVQSDSTTLETDATAANPDSGPDARTPRTKGTTKRTTRTAAKPRPSQLPPEVAADLTKARKALARGAYDEAYNLARRTLSRKRTTQAFSIMARVHCAKRDLRLSKAMIRQLRGAQRRRTIAWCRRHGFDPDPG